MFLLLIYLYLAELSYFKGKKYFFKLKMLC